MIKKLTNLNLEEIVSNNIKFNLYAINSLIINILHTSEYVEIIRTFKLQNRVLTLYFKNRPFRNG